MPSLERSAPTTRRTKEASRGFAPEAVGDDQSPHQMMLRLTAAIGEKIAAVLSGRKPPEHISK